MSAYYCFFPGDYLRDTVHLGWLEDLAYRRLLDLYYSRGKPLPNDRAYLCRAIRANEPEQQAGMDSVLTEFFQLRADGWHNAKADQELAYMESRSEKARKAINARWERERSKNNEVTDTDVIRTNRPSITPTPTPTPTSKEKPTPSRASRSVCEPEFGRFWQAYPRKKSKADAFKAWKRINPSEQLIAQILSAVEQAKTSADWLREGGRYIPYPATWLNGGRWDDEDTALQAERKVAL